MKGIEVGDLVRITSRSDVSFDTYGEQFPWGTQPGERPVGVVTEVKVLVHQPSGDGYTAVTALMGDEYCTLSERDFTLVKKIKR